MALASENLGFNPNEHMIKLKGKDYLPVQARIVWFREGGDSKDAHPIENGWSVQTELVAGGFADDHATVKASVVDPQGRVVATGYKTEDKRGFADFVEKAETGAIGRALGLCGLGTLQALEFDEGGSVCDSPQGKGSSSGSTGGGPSKCSQCSESITQGRVAFCNAKKIPLTCTDCSKG